ncbi:MAG TPA: hypothetical protein VKM55_24955 [Candidatus Lokiarchaeia archaeon]|nr:hypothetical protein [Candidatus Lokiarchaeia archaeon]
MALPAPSFFYLIKVWYAGRAYNGSQYQPGLHTVDGAIVDALRSLDYIPGDASHNENFKVAGRTDKGVSAFGAVYFVALLNPLHPGQVNEWLKENDHEIMIRAVATLDGPVNPRRAHYRIYKYFHVLAGERINIDSVRKGLAVLLGDHDFKGFTKARIDPAILTRRTLDAADLDLVGDGELLVFTFKSQGFLWEQIRRMVAFLIEHHDDEDIDRQVQEVLDTGSQPNLEPAPPGGLILWDIDYGNEFTWENLDGCQAQFTTAMKKRYIEERDRSAITGAVFAAAKKLLKDEDTGN